MEKFENIVTYWKSGIKTSLKEMMGSISNLQSQTNKKKIVR